MFSLSLLLALAAVGYTAPTNNATSTALPVVDLGYTLHQATLNATGPYPLLNFSNIRYGAPPTGDLRFAAPIAPTKINRTVNDGQQAVICPQAIPTWVVTALRYVEGLPAATSTAKASSSAASASLNISALSGPAADVSEDCLFLDLILPEKIYNSPFAVAQRGNSETEEDACGGDESDHGSGAPVLVWLYGGGYVTGNKKSTDNPSTLLARSVEADGEGVIYVAPNYRLGMFGWQASPSFQSQNGTANAGLLDQRLALQWVQKNIHLFGGDKNRVTVIGESAGAGSIAHHITAPASYSTSSLFKQAIAQSPAYQPIVHAQETKTWLETLKIASEISNKTISTLAELRALPFLTLYYTNLILVAQSPYGTFTFGPVIDGSYVPDLPGRRFLAGKYDKQVSILAARNQNEGRFFTEPTFLTATNTTSFDELVKMDVPTASAASLKHIIETLYPPIFNGSLPYTNEFERAALLTQEFTITCHSYELASAGNSSAAGRWKYQFSVPPALHGDDIEYTFFNGDTSSQDIGGGTVVPKVAGVLQDIIVNMAEKGTPNFQQYGTAAGVVFDLNVTRLGSVMPDFDNNERCKYWQAAPWLTEL
ncbi:carboxylic ester hydrolase-15 [Coleophoma cylindrospora]|uniref:Carboxylic ester hydrolase n=1 Tax=Coleophoma cylindrospora TaxID=1849047 RepID=A0A3D8STT0_9HELO|nr:carboxylic ester hydrolase-15 [Coleophoma cylindrospora]